MSIDDRLVDDFTNGDNLQATLKVLEVPGEFFSAEGEEVEPDTIAHLEEWQRKVIHVLSGFHTRMKAREEYSLQDQTDIIASAVQFTGTGSWTNEELQTKAGGAYLV